MNPNTNHSISDDSMSLSSIGDAVGGKACCVCLKAFNKLGRRKFQCGNCSRPVCKQHSQKKRQLGQNQKPQRICDECDQNMVKQQIQLQIDRQITKLNQDLKKARELNQRLNREQFDKTSTLSALENQVKKVQKSHLSSQQALKEKLAQEQARGEKIRQQVEKIRQALDESTRNEQQLSEKCKKTQEEIESLRTQTRDLKQRKEQIKTQIERIQSRLNTSLSLENVSKHLCESCNRKVQNAYNSRQSNPSMIGDQRDSVFQDNRSLLQSIMELNNNPQAAGKSDCQVM